MKHQAPSERLLAKCQTALRIPGELLFMPGQVDSIIYIFIKGSIAVIEKLHSDRRRQVTGTEDVKVRTDVLPYCPDLPLEENLQNCAKFLDYSVAEVLFSNQLG